MRFALILALVLTAASATAQTARLPQFSDYPAGPLYRGRVAPLVEASSPRARLYRTATRRAMAEGVNFAGHYVLAMWGCGTECGDGHVVDARTGRAIADLPFASAYTAFQATSRLITVMTPDEIIGMFPAGEEGAIPGRYGSSYWIFEDGAIRHLGSLLASDVEQIRRGGPVPPLRTAMPGDVLVPLAVRNEWTYTGTAPGGAITVTYRVTGRDPEPYANGVLVERTSRGAGGTRRTAETWSPGYDIGDGSLSVRSGESGSAYFPYLFGVPVADGPGRTERTTARVGGETKDAVCYVTDAGTDDYGNTVRASRTCFVPRVGMVSRTEAGETLTLTSHTLR